VSFVSPSSSIAMKAAQAIQSTESASDLEAMIVKSKKAGTVLKMVLHSRACCLPKGCCTSSPNCWALRKLIKHVFQCRLKSEAGECKVSGCRTVRTLLDHERSCLNAALVDLSQGREPSACIICTVAGVDHRRNSTPPTISLFCGVHEYIAEEKDDCYEEIQSFRPSWLSNSSSGSSSVGEGSSASSMDDLYSLNSSCSTSDPIDSSSF